MNQRRRKILRRQAVTDRTSESPSTQDRKEKRGEFPKRVQLGPNSVGWYEDEIDDYLNSLPRGGPEPPEQANKVRRAGVDRAKAERMRPSDESTKQGETAVM